MLQPFYPSVPTCLLLSRPHAHTTRKSLQFRACRAAIASALYASGRSNASPEAKPSLDWARRRPVQNVRGTMVRML